MACVNPLQTMAPVGTATVAKAADKDAKYVEFSGAGHMDFTDLPLFSPFLGAMLGHGDIDSEECMTKVNSIVLNWFDYYLKNEGSLDIQARY